MDMQQTCFISQTMFTWNESRAMQQHMELHSPCPSFGLIGLVTCVHHSYAVGRYNHRVVLHSNSQTKSNPIIYLNYF